MDANTEDEEVIDNVLNLNGLFIENKYIPEEILSKIFCFLELRDITVCHLVCRQWNELIKNYTWRKKTELVSGQKFPCDERINWINYYSACKKRAFNRNLLLSDNVSVRTSPLYTTNEYDSNGNNPNLPPISVVPIPEDLKVNGKIYCTIHAGSNIYTLNRNRRFVIDLLKEGFTETILDIMQPIIKVSEWYCCKSEETKAEFSCATKLWGVNLDDEYENLDPHVIRIYHFNKRLKNPDQRGRWLQCTYEFKNYGKGVRKIKFYDSGEYGIMMGGASIKLIIPEKVTIANC